MTYLITVAYKSAGQIEALLASIERWATIPLTVLVWDNGDSRDAVLRWEREEKKSTSLQVRLLGTQKNLGFGAAINRCIEEVQKIESQNSPFIVVNPDAEIASPITAELIQELSTKHALVGFRVFNDRDKKVRQASARAFPSFSTSLTGREGMLTRCFPENRFSRRYLGSQIDADKEQRVDWVSGCAFFCDTDTWKKLRGFDESYFLYVEDVDLGRTAHRKGIPVIYSPTLDVVHLIRGSASQRFWQSDFHHHLGMWVYFIKWASPIDFLISPLVFLGIWLRFTLRRLPGVQRG